MHAVIIHGPQGSGKTRYAKDLCELYRCTSWTDWLPGETLMSGILHLTNEIPIGLPGRDVQIISFDEAMKALGEKIVVRHLGTTTWQGPAKDVPEFLGAQPGHNVAPVLTPAQTERLAFLIEECSEVLQEATKIMRFGFESFHPDDPTRETNQHQATDELQSRGNGMSKKPFHKHEESDVEVTFIDGEVKVYRITVSVGGYLPREAGESGILFLWNAQESTAIPIAHIREWKIKPVQPVQEEAV